MLKLGQILVEKQLISSAQLQDVLQIQSLGRKKIGEILVLQGTLNLEDLKIALQEQIWQENPSVQYQTTILNWEIKGDQYQATYGDELGLFIFTISPKNSQPVHSCLKYQVQCELRLLEEKIMSEDCGVASTLQAAQQLAEEKLKQLL